MKLMLPFASIYLFLFFVYAFSFVFTTFGCHYRCALEEQNFFKVEETAFNLQELKQVATEGKTNTSMNEQN